MSVVRAPPVHHYHNISPVTTAAATLYAQLSNSKPDLNASVKQSHHQTHHHHHLHHECGILPGALPRRSFWNLHCSCIFSALPDEILLFNVFSYLDTSKLCHISAVCSRWRFLAGDRLLWSKVDLSNHKKVINDQILGSLVHRYGSFMDVLKLCNCTLLTNNTFHSLGEWTAGLREVHLCNIRTLDDLSVENLLRTSGNTLEHLSLFGCVNITDASVRAITNYCNVLEELSLRGCVKITNVAFDNFITTLKGLNIAGCRHINSTGVSNIVTRNRSLQRLNAHGVTLNDAAIELLSTCCPDLTTLHISSANPFGGNPHITDSSLVSISRLQQLECLNIQGSANITDNGLYSLTQNKLLLRLNLGGCYKITDVGINKLAMSLTELTHLSIFQCFNVTNDGIRVLIERITSLQHLDVHSCVALTNEILTILLSSESGEFKWPHLASLDLGSCRHITAEAVNSFKQIRGSVNVIHY